MLAKRGRGEGQQLVQQGQVGHPHGSCGSVGIVEGAGLEPTHLLGLRGPCSRRLGGLSHRAGSLSLKGLCSDPPESRL